MRSLQPAERAVLLAGTVPHPAPTPVALNDVEQLVRWAADERISGLLSRALSVGDLTMDHRQSTVGADTVDAARFEQMIGEVGQRHVDDLHRCLAVEVMLVDAVDRLRSVGIDAYVFKGAACAHLDYPDPASRAFVDADLHVPRSEFGRAIVMLERAGYVRNGISLPGRWERRYSRACALLSRGGVELDLHAAVVTGYFGERLDHDELRASPDTIELAGREIHAFSAPARLLISAYSLALARGPALRFVRDFLQQQAADVDWSETLRLAGSSGCAVIESGVGAVVDAVGSDMIVEAIRGWQPSPNDAASIRALEFAATAQQTGWSADARSTMLALSRARRADFSLGIAVGKARRWVRGS